MRIYIYVIVLLISGLQLNAQNAKDYIIIDYDGYSLEYTVINNSQKCSVELYSGSPTNVIIPSSVTIEEIQYSVASIERDAFYFCESLTSIEIPSGVTSIGDFAFYCCSDLKNVLFQENSQLTSIGKNSFYNCSSLTSIEIPSGVTSIKYDAFYSCTDLKNVLFQENSKLTSIGENAFYNCSSLTSIEIPSAVLYIGGGAFARCSDLVRISVDEGNAIYDSRENCNAIIKTSANTIKVGCLNTIIPSSVTSIEELAFAGSKMTSIEIPCNITFIGEGAFAGCSDLVRISVDEGNAIYDSRENCNAIIETLTNILMTGCNYTFIPKSVTSIGNAAFESCLGLTSIEIPNSVASIGVDAFGDCLNLKTVTFEDDSQLVSIGNWAFNDCSSLTNIEIPNSVTSIGNWAFYDCSSLRSITFEKDSQLTSIGNAAFESCLGLTSIEIPKSVIFIENFTFNNCLSLKTVTFEDDSQLASIGDFAFNDCSSLTSIEIPKSVTFIGEYAFSHCSSLKTFTSYPITIPTTGYGTFYSCPEDMTIYVPVESLNDYESERPWNNYNIRPIGTNVEEISISFNVYPNPVSNILYIDAKDIIEEVVVYNLNGQTVYNEQCIINNIQLDVSDFNAGLYLIKIRIGGNNIVKRIIKS